MKRAGGDLPEEAEICREERGEDSHVDSDVELAIPPQEAGLSAGKLEVLRLNADGMLRGGIDTEGLDDDSIMSLALYALRVATGLTAVAGLD